MAAKLDTCQHMQCHLQHQSPGQNACVVGTACGHSLTDCMHSFGLSMYVCSKACGKCRPEHGATNHLLCEVLQCISHEQALHVGIRSLIVCIRLVSACMFVARLVASAGQSMEQPTACSVKSYSASVMNKLFFWQAKQKMVAENEFGMEIGPASQLVQLHWWPHCSA